MLVFVDESGDPGFKLEFGSSRRFVAAMVIFKHNQSALETQRTIESCSARKCHRGEFKFSGCSDDIRDKFCEAVKYCDFRIRAIVVDKAVIYSERLKTNKEQFYNFFVRTMLSNHGGVLNGARVIIDGSGDKKFRHELNRYFRAQISSGIVKSVKFKDSKKDSLIQLADMCAGAIARSYRQDRSDAKKWRDMLAPRINDVWEFR